MKTYIEYCKDHAIDELENLKDWGKMIYACDLGYELTDEINVNGSATFNRAAAREYIREWWDEAAEVYEYQKDNYGHVLHNPFENPEAFHVCMIIEGVDRLCANCPTIENAWNDEIELTDEVIDQIIAEIKAQTVIEF